MMTDNSSSNSKSTFYSTQSSLSNLNANGVGLFDSQTIPNEAVTAAPIPSEYDQSNFACFLLLLLLILKCIIFNSDFNFAKEICRSSWQSANLRVSTPRSRIRHCFSRLRMAPAAA